MNKDDTKPLDMKFYFKVMQNNISTTKMHLLLRVSSFWNSYLVLLTKYIPRLETDSYYGTFNTENCGFALSVRRFYIFTPLNTLRTHSRMCITTNCGNPPAVCVALWPHSMWMVPPTLYTVGPNVKRVMYIFFFQSVWCVGILFKTKAAHSMQHTWMHAIMHHNRTPKVWMDPKMGPHLQKMLPSTPETLIRMCEMIGLNIWNMWFEQLSAKQEKSGRLFCFRS